MSWSEDDWGKPFFPTRFGSPQGHATERKMLDAVGGFDGIRTKIRTNPDGSTTILKTRGGMPVFTTTTQIAQHVTAAIPPSVWLYYKMASDVHPWGLQKTPTGKTSARWAWPSAPVSCSEIQSGTLSIDPMSFESSDGPGTLTWEDTRSTQQIANVLSWSPIFGNGRSAHVAYGAGLLNREYYAKTNATAYALQHSYFFEGTWAYEFAGRYLPGQRTTGGSAGNVRFNQSIVQTHVFEDGVKTGIYDRVLAVCKVTGQAETYRALNIVPKTSPTNDMTLNKVPYDASGGAISTTAITMSLAGYSRTEQIIQPPRFNSSGTKAIGIIRYIKTDNTYAVVAIEVDWDSGTATSVTAKADHVQSVSAGSGVFSGSLTYPFPLDVDYIGDVPTILWQKNVISAESENVNTPYSGSRPKDISTDTQTGSWSSTSYLYLDDTVIHSVTSAWTQETSRSSTVNYDQDPVYPHIWYRDVFSSSGTSTTSYAASEQITNVVADLRKKVVLFCVESSEAYSITRNQDVSTTGDNTTFYSTTYTRNTSIVTTGSQRGIKVYLYAPGKVNKVMYENSLAGMNSKGGTVTSTSSGYGYGYNVPAFGYDMPYSPGGSFPAGSFSYTGWVSSPAYHSSQFVESLSMAVDSAGDYAFVSGLLTHGISHYIYMGIDDTIYPTLANFDTLATLVSMKNWSTTNLPITEFPSDDGWPGKVWVSEPLFLKQKAIEP